MQFQIPQFIEVEDKIVGPLTLKQFLYLAGAAAVSFILFFLLQFWLWLIITVIVGSIGVAFAFIKYNSQPLPKIFLQFFLYFWRPRLYLWQRELREKTFEVGMPERPTRGILSGMPSVKKLWQEMLTTKTPIPKREKKLGVPLAGKKAKEQFQLFRKISGEKEIARRIDYR